MKKMILKNWMTALLLTGTCCGFVACDNKDGEDTPQPPTAPDATAVMGQYNGTMATYQIAPNQNEGEEPSATPLDATISADAILFTDFPVRDLIVQVLGDQTLADQIVAKIGQVDYSVPYTALMSADNAGVKLTLSPEPLILTLTNDGEEGQEPTSTEIQVEIIAQTDGLYSIDSECLEFRISAATVKLDETELPGFKPFTLGFDLAKE